MTAAAGSGPAGDPVADAIERGDYASKEKKP